MLDAPHLTLSTADAYQRLMAHDPALMAALHQGDPLVADAVGRVLRLTSLRRLASDRMALVAALVALPQLHPLLQRTWQREDPALTANLFSWAEQARRHHSTTRAPQTAA